jgi:WD40 repeat protein
MISFIAPSLGAMEVKVPNTLTRRDVTQMARALRSKAIIVALHGAFPCNLIDLVMQYDDADLVGHCVKTIDTNSLVSTLVVLPDGTLALGLASGKILIYPLSGYGRNECQLLEGQDGSDVRYAIYLLLPIDGRRFLSVSGMGFIKLWRKGYDGYQCTQHWNCDDFGQVSAMMRLPDDRLMVGMANGDMMVWTLCSSAQINTCSLDGHNSMVIALADLVDDQIASASLYDVKVLAKSNDKLPYRCKQTIPWPDGNIAAMVVVSGKTIAVGSSDGTVTLLAPDGDKGFVRKQQLGTVNISAAIRSLAVLYQDLLASCADDGKIMVWKRGTAGDYQMVRVLADAKGFFDLLAGTAMPESVTDLLLVTDRAKGGVYVFE